MSVYSYLKKKQKYKKMSLSDEYAYYLKNQDLLNKVQGYSRFTNIKDEFELMQANIIIKGYKNKLKIEEELDNIIEHEDKNKDGFIPSRELLLSRMHSLIVELPYFKEKDSPSRIYIPFFSRALNMIYSYDIDKLAAYPYLQLKKEFSASIVDPFETYGFDMYDSLFTKLVRIGGNEDSAAFYHIDYKTIYFIDDQGLLDTSVHLFDKYMKRIGANHIIERITPVVDAYYNNSYKDFVEALANGNLISRKMHHTLLRRERKRKNERRKWQKD